MCANRAGIGLSDRFGVGARVGGLSGKLAIAFVGEHAPAGVGRDNQVLGEFGSNRGVFQQPKRTTINVEHIELACAVVGGLLQGRAEFNGREKRLARAVTGVVLPKADDPIGVIYQRQGVIIALERRVAPTHKIAQGFHLVHPRLRQGFRRLQWPIGFEDVAARVIRPRPIVQHPDLDIGQRARVLQAIEHPVQRRVFAHIRVEVVVGNRVDQQCPALIPDHAAVAGANDDRLLDWQRPIALVVLHRKTHRLHAHREVGGGFGEARRCADLRTIDCPAVGVDHIAAVSIGTAPLKADRINPLAGVTGRDAADCGDGDRHRK